jgi:hypothetical protein
VTSHPLRFADRRAGLHHTLISPCQRTIYFSESNLASSCIWPASGSTSKESMLGPRRVASLPVCALAERQR